ncbi:MAG: ABC transporter substrate-binding protein [Candidatus Woesearchaeota archaeon]
MIISNKKILLITFLLITFLSISLTVNASETVTDMQGREVEIPDEVNRVITTYTPATQFVLALNAGDKLVSGSSGGPTQKISKKINSDIMDLPEVGSKREGINIESVMDLNPDLVIMFPHEDGIETTKKLEDLGISTVIINPESFSQIKETIDLLAKILDKENQGKIIKEEYERIEEISNKANKISEEDKKSVYFANSEFLDTVGSKLLQSDMIAKAGGINSAESVKEGFVKSSAEEIINWNPEVVILSQFFGGNVDDLKNNNKYQKVSAFKNDEIHRIPSDLEPWDYPSPSSPLMIPWLVEKLYPEEFQNLDVEGLVNDFYEKVYGVSYSNLAGDLN